MSYEITGDDATGYTITLPRWGTVGPKCPCCDKMINTRKKAEIIAANLQLIADASPRSHNDAG